MKPIESFVVGIDSDPWGVIYQGAIGFAVLPAFRAISGGPWFGLDQLCFAPGIAKESLSNASLRLSMPLKRAFLGKVYRLDGGARGLAAPSGVMRTQASFGPGTDWRALKQREHLRSVLGDAAIAHLAVVRLAIHDAEHALDLRAHAAEATIAGTLPGRQLAPWLRLLLQHPFEHRPFLRPWHSPSWRNASRVALAFAVLRRRRDRDQVRFNDRAAAQKRAARCSSTGWAGIDRSICTSSRSMDPA